MIASQICDSYLCLMGWELKGESEEMEMKAAECVLDLGRERERVFPISGFQSTVSVPIGREYR